MTLLLVLLVFLTYTSVAVKCTGQMEEPPPLPDYLVPDGSGGTMLLDSESGSGSGIPPLGPITETPRTTDPPSLPPGTTTEPPSPQETATEPPSPPGTTTGPPSPPGTTTGPPSPSGTITGPPSPPGTTTGPLSPPEPPSPPGTSERSRFFPYGVENGDTLAPPALDKAFGPVNMDVPVVIFQNTETSFYVSSNGLISAREVYFQYVPSLFTREFSEFPHAIIAPLWADFDSSVQGSIYYRVTNDSEVLDQIVDTISNLNSDINSYAPKQALIATWEDIIPYNSFDGILYNFQAVIATDGKTSFAIFLYGNIATLNASDLQPTQTGFNSGEGTGMSNIPQSSIQPLNVYRIDGFCVEKVGNDTSNCPLTANSTSFAFECDAQEMTPTMCLCDVNSLNHSGLCFSLGFFPFGTIVEDKMIPGAIDGSEDITPDLPFAIPFYQNMESELFVSTNGVLSFERKFTDFLISPFPTSSVPLIAPLWADFDFRSQGQVFYRVSEDQETLERARQVIVEANNDYADYSPQFCVIVTWSGAVLFSRDTNSRPVTFQVVLSTDGTNTFVQFIYDNLFLIEGMVGEENAAIGFDAGDNSRSVAVAPGTISDSFGFVNVFRIDGNCITNVTSADGCDLNSTSLQCSGFTASSCLCQPEFAENSKCRLTSFLPFGFGSDDSEGPRQVDSSSSLVLESNSSIVFFQKEYTELFISTNGFISFEKKFITDSYIPVSFPRSSGEMFAMIAPLWADFNFRNGGTLYYRIEDKQNVLDMISEKLATQNKDYESYTPTLAVIVTWFESTLFQRDIITNFQAVLVTDGSTSFLILNYEDYVAVIDSFDNSGIPYQSGMDAGDTIRSTQIRRSGNDTEFFFRIDGDCIVPVAMDVCGMESIPLNCAEALPSSSSCLCKPGHNTSDTCLDFLPFDDRAGDEILVHSNRAQVTDSSNLPLSIPVVLYGQQHREIQVHVGGYISFGAVTITPSLCPFNLSSSPLPVISPVSSLADNCLATAVLHYRVLTQQTDTQTLPAQAQQASTETTPFQLTDMQTTPQQTDTQTPPVQQTDTQTVQTNKETLAQVVARIATFNPELASFEPSLAVVITWKLSINDSSETTFVQSILASDGVISFALFLYQDTEEVSSLLSQNVVGFSTGGNRSKTTELEEVDKINIFRLDGECITSAAAGRVCGLNSVTAECDSLNATTCTCNHGYMSVDGFICADLNECTEGLDDCSQTCTNTDGGFTCSCESGHQLLSDNKTCEDKDECSAPVNPCDHSCTNTQGGYVCSCMEGYQLNNDNTTCTQMVTMATDVIRSTSHVLEISLGVIFGLIAVCIAIVIALLIAIMQRKKKAAHERTISCYLDERCGSELSSNHYIKHTHISVQSSYKANIPRHLIVPSSKLTIGTSIGQGEFGVVYRGQLKQSFSDTVSETVAVKTLKGFVQKHLIRELLKECAKMQKFDHPNVLKLMGVCLDGGPAPYIIMPFMANGSLLSYLKKERDQLVVDKAAEAECVEKKLLDMCLQVAKGMEYLASKRVIHRDLAARNCMIDVNFVIKVADFGLSESIETSKDYFRQNQEDVVKLPIKWLAPESINDALFSEKSDVWAYGVTCWEVFSGGKTPYPGIHAMDLPHQLDNGMRLEKPLNAACTDEIYSLVMQCFKAEVEQRPTFSELVNTQSSMLGLMAGYMDFSPSNQTLIRSSTV